jgi:outer membrane biogenesis lipoprotein LolB
MSVEGRARPSARRVLLALLGTATLLLGGCGDPATDATVTRSEQQAEQLRERLRRVQGAS